MCSACCRPPHSDGAQRGDVSLRWGAVSASVAWWEVSAQLLHLQIYASTQQHILSTQAPITPKHIRFYLLGWVVADPPAR